MDNNKYVHRLRSGNKFIKQLKKNATPVIVLSLCIEWTQ